MFGVPSLLMVARIYDKFVKNGKHGPRTMPGFLKASYGALLFGAGGTRWSAASDPAAKNRYREDRVAPIAAQRRDIVICILSSRSRGIPYGGPWQRLLTDGMRRFVGAQLLRFSQGLSATADRR